MIWMSLHDHKFCHIHTISKMLALEKKNYEIQSKNNLDYDEGY